MNIDSIKDGIVIDHITAGKGMELYRLLKLDQLDCSVALIKNAVSQKMGKKDILKIDTDFHVDMDILGYVDPGVTVAIIRDGVIVKKLQLTLPEQLTNVIFCKNPRCISSTEQELPHVFRLTDPKTRTPGSFSGKTKEKGPTKPPPSPRGALFLSARVFGTGHPRARERDEVAQRRKRRKACRCVTASSLSPPV